MTAREIEEVLEALWTCNEKREYHIDDLKKCCDIPVDAELLKTMEWSGLIAHDGEMVLLTKDGKEKAGEVIRRHRLAERLLVDILNIPIHQVETGACEFEHILATPVVDSICTLLGHPRECPHGGPIPPGKCCLASTDVVNSLVVPITKLEVGSSAKIAYLSTPSHPRLHKLISFGLTPGATVKLHQQSPSYIISCGQTELAVEEAVARDIFVWKLQ